MKKISSKQTSMTEYTENYKITRKRKLTNEKQSVDKRNRIVEPRDKSDQDVIVDLKFRISPPEIENPKWCAGSLALHIPHVSVDDLITIKGERKNIVDAYKYYSLTNTE